MKIGLEIFYNQAHTGQQGYSGVGWVPLDDLLIDGAKITQRLMSGEKAAVNTCKAKVIDRNIEKLGGMLSTYITNNKNIEVRLVDRDAQDTRYRAAGFTLGVFLVRAPISLEKLRLEIGNGRIDGAEIPGKVITKTEVTPPFHTSVIEVQNGELVINDYNVVPGNFVPNTSSDLYSLMPFIYSGEPGEKDFTNYTFLWSPSRFLSTHELLFTGVIRPLTKIDYNAGTETIINLDMADGLYTLDRKSEKEIFIASGWTSNKMPLSVNDVLNIVFNTSDGYGKIRSYEAQHIHFNPDIEGSTIEANALYIAEGDNIKTTIDNWLFQYGLVLEEHPGGELRTAKILSDPLPTTLQECDTRKKYSLKMEEPKYGSVKVKYGEKQTTQRSILDEILVEGDGTKVTHFTVSDPFDKFNGTDNNVMLDKLENLKIEIFANFYQRIRVDGNGDPYAYYYPGGLSEAIKIAEMEKTTEGWRIRYTATNTPNNDYTYTTWEDIDNHNILPAYVSPTIETTLLTSDPAHSSYVRFTFAIQEFSLTNGNFELFPTLTLHSTGDFTALSASIMSGKAKILMTADEIRSDRGALTETVEVPGGNPNEEKEVVLYNTMEATDIPNIVKRHYGDNKRLIFSSVNNYAVGRMITIEVCDCLSGSTALIIEKKYTASKAGVIYEYIAQITE